MRACLHLSPVDIAAERRTGAFKCRACMGKFIETPVTKETSIYGLRCKCFFSQTVAIANRSLNLQL